MRKIANAILAIALVAGAVVTASAQSEETRQVSGFHAIGSGGAFHVHVKINGTESLKIVTDEADNLAKIETVVEGGTLKIGNKKHSNWSSKDQIHGHVDIYITARELSDLSNAGSGSIDVDGVVKGDDVHISLSGSGSLDARVKAGSLKTSIAGSGSIHIDGNADESDISISGSGSLNAKEFKTNTANVSIAGSGNAYLTAEKTISGHIAGSGNVVYTGNATQEDIHTAGSGRVSHE